MLGRDASSETSSISPVPTACSPSPAQACTRHMGWLGGLSSSPQPPASSCSPAPPNPRSGATLGTAQTAQTPGRSPCPARATGERRRHWAQGNGMFIVTSGIIRLLWHLQIFFISLQLRPKSCVGFCYRPGSLHSLEKKERHCKSRGRDHTNSFLPLRL